MKGSQSRLPFFVVGFSKEYDGLPLVSWTCQLDFLFLYSPPPKKKKFCLSSTLLFDMRHRDLTM
jgi:hypothetical protein